MNLFKKKISFLFLFVLFFANQKCFARNTTEFKHDVIARIIQFINTDTTAFQKPVTEAYSGTNLSELKNHYASLPKVSRKIDDINAIKIDDQTDELKNNSSLAFIDKAVKSISSDKKEYRKKMPSFKQFKEDLNELQLDFVSSATSNYNNSTVGVLVDGGSVANPNANLIWRKIDYFLIGLPIFLSLLLLLFNIRKSKYKMNNSDNESFNKNVNKLQIEIDSIKKENKLLIEKLENINLRMIGIEEHIGNIVKATQNQVTQKTEKQEVVKSNPDPVSNSEQNESKNKPIVKVYFSDEADHQDGFTLNSLKETSTNTSIFKITIINDNEATYEVNSNPNAQSLAIRYFETYFSRLANYNRIPTQASNTIVNGTKGKLILRNNIWVISNKLEINIQ